MTTTREPEISDTPAPLLAPRNQIHWLSPSTHFTVTLWGHPASKRLAMEDLDVAREWEFLTRSPGILDLTECVQGPHFILSPYFDPSACHHMLKSDNSPGEAWPGPGFG